MRHRGVGPCSCVLVLLLRPTQPSPGKDWEHWLCTCQLSGCRWVWSCSISLRTRQLKMIPPKWGASFVIVLYHWIRFQKDLTRPMSLKLGDKKYERKSLFFCLLLFQVIIAPVCWSSDPRMDQITQCVLFQLLQRLIASSTWCWLSQALFFRTLWGHHCSFQ